MATDQFYGDQISVQRLSFFSSRLNGDHWIWARKGDTWRVGIFARERQLDLQAASRAEDLVGGGAADRHC